MYNSVTLFTSENRWQEAIEIVDRQRRIVRRHVEHVLPSLTARQQLLYLILHDNSPWAFALTLGLERKQTPAAASRSAEWLLNSKAIAQETLTRTACLMQGSNDPQVAATWAKLLDARRQLAELVVSGGNPGGDSESQETAEQLSATEKKLAQQLADATGRNFPDDPWVQLDDIRRSIPSDGVLINIARFDVFNFAGKTPAETWKAAHYAAWIVPPAEQGDVKVVDLGEATIIDDAVEEFQKAMQAAAGAGTAKSLIAELGEQRAEAEMQKALAKVAHRVWEPLAAEIGSNTQKLLLCPDGMLWLVPWEALPIEDGKYAIENYEIRLLTSGRELASAATTPRKTAPSVIFADPDYDLGHSQVETATQRVLRGAPSMNAQLRGLTAGRSATALPKVGRLKGTATEAAAIQPNLERYTGRQPIAYLDQFATEGVFKALHRPQILVLSTHGFFLPEQNSSTAKQSDSSQADPRATQAVLSNGQLVENPLLRCGLLLAGCNRNAPGAPETRAGNRFSRNADRQGNDSLGDDGVLTGMEIAAADLQGTELVVLSACETALGAVQAGEGVSGLRQAFQLAGAKSVVATLWQIPDMETSQLMGQFFDGVAGGQSTAEALRRAQLAQIKARRQRSGAAHPYYWAAFTITGQ